MAPRKFSPVGRLLRALLAPRGATIVHLLEPLARQDLAIVRDTRARTDLLIEDAAAFEILAYVRGARRAGGAMAELGVFAGGTARLICEAKGDATLHLFDVFDTLQGTAAPPPNDEVAAQVRDLFGTWHTPRATVERLLADYPSVAFHPGVFPASARGLEQEQFCFVHLDADLESSTREALRFFHPRLRPGGIIIGDDYGLPGVRRAFADYYANQPDSLVALPWGQVVAVKVSASSTT